MKSLDKIIFLSAQPDDYFFLWQLELQIYNFLRLGINPSQIHILLGFHPSKGLCKDFQNFITENKRIVVHAYPDTRRSKKYLSSIRPHLIAKHFEKFSFLQDSIIFYHDSDIIFRDLPDFDQLIKTDSWYASDTSSYTGINCIKSVGGSNLLTKMCNVIGLNTGQLDSGDKNAGGAQYVIKKANAQFWKKVESDCENLYLLLEKFNARKVLRYKRSKSIVPVIDSWLVDIWSLWWNAQQSKYRFEIHPELDFCLATDTFERWREVKILHYAGFKNTKNSRLFNKANYLHYAPYFENFASIDKKTSGYQIVNLISEYSKARLQHKFDLSTISFLFPVRIGSTGILDNIITIIRYLSKQYNTSIYLLEADSSQKIDEKKLPTGVYYSFNYDSSLFFDRPKYLRHLIAKTNTSTVFIPDTDIVFSTNHLLKAIRALESENCDAVTLDSKKILSIDPLMKQMFMKILDIELLECNRGKFVSKNTTFRLENILIKKSKSILTTLLNRRNTTKGCKRVASPFLYHLPIQ